MAMGNSHGEINMTPLIDVLLVLLIIFMVITPVTPKGLEAKVPQESDQRASAPEENVVLSVSKSGLITVNREVVELAGLRDHLAALFQRRAVRVCFVKGNEELDFETVAQVIDVARDAGLNQVALVRMRE
jgi:biopolymer transport protein TolR